MMQIELGFENKKGIFKWFLEMVCGRVHSKRGWGGVKWVSVGGVEG